MALLALLALLAIPPTSAVAAGSVGILSGPSHGDASGAWAKADGTVWTWGMNGYGQLGNGTSGAATRSLSPVQVLTAPGTPLTGVVQVEVGDDTIVARKSDGTVWGWGFNGCGELMQGNYAHQPHAVRLNASSGVPITTAVDIANGTRPFILLSDGRILSNQPTGGGCSQYPVALQYSNGTTITSAIDVASSGSNQHFAFARSDGTAWSYGSNTSAKLGQGLDPSATPSTSAFGQMLTAAGTPITSVSQVAAGSFHTIVRRSDGTVWAAGFDGAGELSNTAVTSNVPYLTRMETSTGVALTGAVDISAVMQQNILVRRSDDSIWGSGYYTWGQQGETSCCGDPVRQRLTGFLDLDGGGLGTTLLIRSDDQAMGTGVNSRGEAGVCHTRTLASPVAISTTCSGPYSPWRPSAMSARDADGSTMRCSSVCWTRSGVTDSVNIGFSVSDQDPTDTLTPRFQFSATPVTMSPFDACTAAGVALASVATTTSNQDVAVQQAQTGLTHGTSYKYRACTVDSGGRTSGWTYDDLWRTGWTSIDTSTAFTVDTVPPAAPTSVIDGNPTDIDWQRTTTSLVGTMSGASDALSGIWGVSYCVTTSAGGADCSTTAVRPWTSRSTVSTPGTWTASSLTLTSGTTYYMCARSEDYAKNVSSTFVCSDGVTIDTVAPSTSVPNDGTGTDSDLTTSATTLDSNWAAGTDSLSGVASYDWCFTTSATGGDCVSGALRTWTNTTGLTAQATGLALIHGTKYHACIRARDTAGNLGTATCSDGAVLDINAPTATLVSPADAATGQPLMPGLTATYDDADGDTGTVAFEVCSDSACATAVRSGTSAAVTSGSNATWTVSPTLAANTTYWWRARSTDVLGRSSAWTAIRSFATVNAPTIVDNQLGDATWRNANTTAYDVDFADAVALASFETNVWSGAAQTGTQRQAWTQVSALSGTSYATNWMLLGTTWTAMAEGVNHVSVRVTNTNAMTTTNVDTFYVRKDTVPPNAVTTLATSSPTIVAPALTWTTVTDATSGVAYYRVHRGSSSTGPWTLVSTDGAVTTGSFADTGAAVNATHHYRVQAVDLAGNEAATSNTVSAYYHRAPSPPTLVSPADLATSVQLLPTLTATHSDPDGHTGTLAFEVCADSGCSTVARSGSSVSGIASGSNGSWTVGTELAQGTQYWWRARSTDQHGAVGTWSVVRTFTTSSGPTITDNQLGDTTWRSANTGTYDVDFSDPLGMDRFEVRVWSAAGQTGTMRQDWTVVAGSIAGTSYTTDWALPASTWTAMAEGVNYVTVRAWNDTAGSATRADVFEVRKDTTAAAPGIVSDGAATDVDWWASTSSFDGNWAASAGEVGLSGVLRYEYCIGTAAACTGTIARTWTSATAVTSITATSLSLVNGTLYYLAVRMVDNAGNTSTAASSDAFRIDAIAPTAPTLVSPADAGTVTTLPTFTATYNDPAPASPGQLEFQVCSTSTCSAVTTSGTSAAGIAAGSNGSWTPASLVGGSYWWRARGTDSAATTGPWSIIRALAISYPPTAPTPVSPANGAWVNTVTPTLAATFNDPDAGATGQLTFEACATDAADPWSVNCASGYQSVASASGIAAGANGSATLGSVPNGETRHWRVRGNDGSSSSPWSVVRTVRIDTAPPPAITTLAIPSPTTTAPSLSWTTVADGESGTAFYRVYRSGTSGTLGSQVNADGATTAGSWSDTTGVSSGTWYYTVRAVDAVGNEQAVGNDQRSVAYVAPIYFRATASLATAAPSSWLLSRTAGTVVNTATSPRIGRSQGCSIQFVTNTANNTTCVASPPAAPSGGGWLMDASPGESFAAGSWRMHLTVAAQRTHTGFLQVNAWKVTLDGAGAIQAGAQQLTSGGWTLGTSNLGAATLPTSHFVDVPMSQVAFAAGEHLYVEAWEHVTAESGNNTTNVTLQVDTTAERIEPTAPIPPMSVTGTTPSSLGQGRKAVVVRVNGGGFQNGASVAFSGSGIAITSTSWVSASAIDVTLDVAGTAAVGARDVTVTNPDTTTATATGAFSVTAPSLTIGFSTLGYGDAARDTSAPHDVGFGAMLPGTTKEIGPATSSQTLAGAAIEASVTSDTDWILQLDSTDFSGATTMAASQLAFKRYSVAEGWTALSTTPTTVSGPNAPGSSTIRHDLQLAIPALQLAGTYSTSLDYTVVAAP